MSGIRVAAAQFAVGDDVAVNLATCVRLADMAADRGAELVVLPAYCNHVDLYEDRDHAWRVACTAGDQFFAGLAEAARGNGIYLKAHVTLAEDDRVTATNLLFGPCGEVVARGDTRVLAGSAQQLLDPAREREPIVDTPVGRVAMYGGTDGAVAEIPRHLALNGAQILLASLSAITTDDARLHVPVRAAENRSWVIAANVIGQRSGPPDRRRLAPEWLNGAGESQIVRPDGVVAARAPRFGEAVVVADIVPGWADDKTRPDGGDLFLARRPRLYAPADPVVTRDDADVAERVVVSVVRQVGHGMSGIDEAAELVRAAAADGVDLVVLPELFFYSHGRADGSFVDGIAVDVLSQALAGTRCHVVTSLPDDSAHVGMLIGAAGVRGRQLQLHSCARHIAWQATLGDRLIPFDLEWGRLVIVVGDDSLYPETFGLAALADTDVVAVPCTAIERWELTLGLPERVAEHRLSVVAASHPGPGGGGVILTPAPDPVPSSERVGGFTGALNAPVVTPVADTARVVTGEIYPRRSRHREPPAARADVVSDRPWRFSGALGLAPSR